MAKIFAAQAELNNHPARNNFDLSHKVHMSGKMGTLYPVLCKPVVPGDTFRISSGCAFNFFPMPYPTQTRMRFIMHFFYVRNKNIWENWENWLQGLEDHVPPYIEQQAEFYSTGSIADFLDIPTTAISLNPTVPMLSSLMGQQVDFGYATIPMSGYVREGTEGYPSQFNDFAEDVYVSDDKSALVGNFMFQNFHIGLADDCQRSVPMTGNGWTVGTAGRFAIVRFYDINTKVMPRLNEDGSLTFRTGKPMISAAGGASFYLTFWAYRLTTTDPSYGGYTMIYKTKLEGIFQPGQEYYEFTMPKSMVLVMRTILDEHPEDDLKLGVVAPYGAANIDFATCNTAPTSGQWPVLTGESMEVSEVGSTPYYGASNMGEDSVKISALPFRAYESIYNAFYRNQHGNQPFMIDGVTQYNKYNTTKADGADTTDYKLMQRNWELDAYTSCLPSPQQGPAPVVGITALGKVTIVDPETGVTTTAQATDTSRGIQISDVNLGEESHQRYLVNLANSGITINDFRQVNALQRFLETNIRKGFRYVDFIEGHFGKRIKDAIMDMPEFIGGFSQGVDVGMISNTNGVGDQESPEALGSYAGQASAFGGSKHSITHYCDDYGFIMGIMCLVPDPTYSQILPKHFNVKQPLDYYFPEFSQIGLQPITYEELCPVQSHMEYMNDNNKKLTDVFGYQRPNHDLVWYPDTLHGEFRKTFNRYIVNRLYAQRPELSNDFLIIKPEETNNIFSYMAPDSDVFVGQLAFDIKAKRPVPRIVIPGLGR